MTINDYPLSVNPAYRYEPKPVTGSDYIDVPVYDNEGEELFKERISFGFEQYNNDMVVYMEKNIVAEMEDIHSVMSDNYRNFKIEYK